MMLKSLRIGRSVSLQAKRSLSIFSSISDFFGPKVDIEPYHLFSPEFDKTKFRSISTHSDDVYEGGSKCEYSFVDENTKNQTLRFKGSLNFSEDHVENSKIKALHGFCALRMFFDKEHDLRDYVGLELVMRSSKEQPIIFNMICDTFSASEIYQLPLVIPSTAEGEVGKSQWVKVFVPFEWFVLTLGGELRLDSYFSAHINRYFSAYDCI